MAVEVTRPIEEALRSIPGVRKVQSTTSRGSAEVTLTFDWGNDMTSAYLQAQAEIARLLPSLPAGSTFAVRRMDPTVFPVIAYSVTSAKRSPAELHDLCQYQLRPVLSAVPGVARIGVDGGAALEVHVVADPAKLAAHGLALSDVTTALSAANTLTAVGRLQDHFKLYLVVADAQFKTVDEVGQTIVHSGPGGVTLLADVAAVTRATVPQFIHSTADGRDCVLVNVYQQPGGNTVDIAAGIRAALAAERGRLPADLTVTSWYDQSDLITGSATGVRDAVLIGVGLGRRRAPAVPAGLAADAGRRRQRAGRAGDHGRRPVRAGPELQHHDPGRHGGGRRADHRRRDRHVRAHRPPPRRRRGRAGRGRRVHPAVGRVVAVDDRDPRPAGVPGRRVRGVLRRAVAVDGDQSRDLVLRRLAGDPGAGRGPAQGHSPPRAGAGRPGRGPVVRGRHGVGAAGAVGRAAGRPGPGPDRVARVRPRRERRVPQDRRGRVRHRLPRPARGVDRRDGRAPGPRRGHAAAHAGGAGVQPPHGVQPGRGTSARATAATCSSASSRSPGGRSSR